PGYISSGGYVGRLRPGPCARSNCFHPYPQGASPLTDGKSISKEYYPPELWNRPEKKKELAELVPVGRLQTADDLWKLISFPASGPTAFLTGDTIKIDGGALVSASV
ncbi:MAG TPA: hypothetical protein VGD83_37835, partial [Streptosporangiaceae bacterium]